MVFASYSSASMQRLVSKFSGFGGTEACIAYSDDAGNDYPEIDSVESKQANNKQQWQLQHLTNY